MKCVLFDNYYYGSDYIDPNQLKKPFHFFRRNLP